MAPPVARTESIETHPSLEHSEKFADASDVEERSTTSSSTHWAALMSRSLAARGEPDTRR